MYCTHVIPKHKTQTRDYYPSDDGVRCTVHAHDTWTQDSNSEIITPQMMVWDVLCTHTLCLNIEHKTNRQRVLEVGAVVEWSSIVYREYFVAGASAVPDGPGCPGNCLSKGNLFLLLWFLCEDSGSAGAVWICASFTEDKTDGDLSLNGISIIPWLLDNLKLLIVTIVDLVLDLMSPLDNLGCCNF